MFRGSSGNSGAAMDSNRPMNERTIATALLLVWLGGSGPGVALAQPCELTARLTHRDLDVRVAGAPTIRISVHDADVIGRPMAGGRAMAVEVRASLGFEATAIDLPARLVERVETGHGMISLASTTRIDGLRPDGDDLRLVAHLNPWVRITGLGVPCASVTLSRATTVVTSSGPTPPASDGARFRPLGRALALHAEPGSDERIRIELDRGAPFDLERVASRAGWIRLAWTDGGSLVVGWARAAHVRRSPRHGWGGPSGSGTPGCVPPGRASGPGLYRGPAAVRAGSLVRVAPRGPVWASARDGDGFEVAHARGAAWVQILVAPGLSEGDLCGELRSAWVRLEDVTLPQDHDRRR